jgi:hypothetical protein
MDDMSSVLKKKTIGNVLAVVLDVVARKSCSKPPRVKPIFSYFVQPKTPKKHNENIKKPIFDIKLTFNQLENKK